MASHSHYLISRLPSTKMAQAPSSFPKKQPTNQANHQFFYIRNQRVLKHLPSLPTHQDLRDFALVEELSHNLLSLPFFQELRKLSGKVSSL